MHTVAKQIKPNETLTILWAMKVQHKMLQKWISKQKPDGQEARTEEQGTLQQR